MYLPERFTETNPDLLKRIIVEFPFASLVSVDNGEPFINLLPLTCEDKPDGSFRLLGHMSRHNPQWRHFKAGAPTTIVFQGPDAYVNPNWYVENDVPTWSYLSVQLKGTIRLIEDYAGLLKLLAKLAKQAEPWDANPWSFYLPPDLKGEDVLPKAIIGFEVEPVEIKGKFKTFKNRSREDQERVIIGLRTRKDEKSLLLAKWMEESLG